MGKILVSMAVTKMSIGRTDKDERDESGGLTTKLAFDVQGSPRSLARMANVLKQGNVNIMLNLEVTNAAYDVEVETVNIPHQMGLDERPIIPAVPPVATTPIRSGEPIVKTTEELQQEAETNAEFDEMESANPGTPDLSKFAIRVPSKGHEEYTVSLNGTRKKGTELVETILLVFAAKNAEELTNTLLGLAQSDNRDLILEILQQGKMPEKVK